MFNLFIVNRPVDFDKHWKRRNQRIKTSAICTWIFPLRFPSHFPTNQKYLRSTDTPTDTIGIRPEDVLTEEQW